MKFHPRLRSLTPLTFPVHLSYSPSGFLVPIIFLGHISNPFLGGGGRWSVNYDVTETSSLEGLSDGVSYQSQIPNKNRCLISH